MSEQLIVSDPAIRGGAWRIAGTRIPVWMVQDMHDAGLSAEQMIAWYPTLTGRQTSIAAAIAFRRPREIVVYGDVEGLLIVRESTIPGDIEIVWQRDDGDESEPQFPTDAIPALIAALEQAREWGDADAR